MEVPLYQVDAFTTTAFAGNAAAVCLLPRAALPLGDALRQRIAAEMNLSETAFLEVAGDGIGDDWRGAGRFRLRWFTPAVEVPLCGHATLAAAAALLKGEGCDLRQPLRFDTLSGELTVRAEAQQAEDPAAAAASGATTAADLGCSPLLCMDFPLIEATAESVPSGLGPGSEVVKAAVGDLPVESVLYAPPLRYLLVVLKSEGPPTREAFLALRPDVQRLEAAHAGGQLVGVIVTLQGDGSSPHDFLSRFFAPWAGIPEDPVTGSAHSVLGPYWARRLGRQRLAARQCSVRGGELRVTVDESAARVEIAGHAVLVLRGRLLLPSGSMEGSTAGQ